MVQQHIASCSARPFAESVRELIESLVTAYKEDEPTPDEADEAANDDDRGGMAGCAQDPKVGFVFAIAGSYLETMLSETDVVHHALFCTGGDMKLALVSRLFFRQVCFNSGHF